MPTMKHMRGEAGRCTLRLPVDNAWLAPSYHAVKQWQSAQPDIQDGPPRRLHATSNSSDVSLLVGFCETAGICALHNADYQQ